MINSYFLIIERQWNMWIPGFGTDELRPYKRAPVTEAHKQRMALIRKTLKKYWFDATGSLFIFVILGSLNKTSNETRNLNYVFIGWPLLYTQIYFSQITISLKARMVSPLLCQRGYSCHERGLIFQPPSYPVSTQQYKLQAGPESLGVCAGWEKWKSSEVLQQCPF